MILPASSTNIQEMKLVSNYVKIEKSRYDSPFHLNEAGRTLVSKADKDSSRKLQSHLWNIDVKIVNG